MLKVHESEGRVRLATLVSIGQRELSEEDRIFAWQGKEVYVPKPPKETTDTPKPGSDEGDGTA